MTQRKNGIQIMTEDIGEFELKKSAKWYVYMIEVSDGSLYTGITTDVARRFREHRGSSRGAKYFRGRSPRALKYVEPQVDRSAASKREYEIKRLSATAKRALVAAQSEGALIKLAEIPV